MGFVRPLGRGREEGAVSNTQGFALDLCLFKRDLSEVLLYIIKYRYCVYLHII